MKIKEILDWLDMDGKTYTFEGNEDIDVSGFSSLANYQEGTITWIKKRENVPKGTDIHDITLAVTQKGHSVDCPNQILTEESKAIFFGIIEHLFHQESMLPEIGQGTYISSDVVIGKNVRIGHNCVLDGEIIIGDNTQIYHNVTIINKVELGKNCIIQSGASIGHDGFSYVEDDEYNKKMIKHYGGVWIGNDVTIGTNTVVARGTIDDTRIQDNCKVDNLCHIAHNVILEESVTVIAGTLLYGSSHIGKNVYIASGIVRNQTNIGSNAFVGMGAVVTKDVPEHNIVIGLPAKSIKIGDKK